MEPLRRVAARLCARLPGRSGLVGYVVCCVLPCKLCRRVCRRGRGRRAGSAGQGPETALEAALLPEAGLRHVVLLGASGSGKSSFLWMSEHPGETALPGAGARAPGPAAQGGCSRPAAPLEPTEGVRRITRKGAWAVESGCLVDLDLCEVGGGERTMPYWTHYITRGLHTLAFFVDASSPPASLDEAAARLAELRRAASAAAPRARILLVASRADAPGAARPEQLLEEIRRRAPPGSDLRGGPPAAALALGGGARRSCDELLRTLAELSV